MKTKIIILSVLLIVMSAILCSCGFLSSFNSGDNGGNNSGNNDTPEEIYFIFHDVPNSFNATANDFYNSKTGLLRIPANKPTKEGYEFVDWYADEACAKLFPIGEKPTTKEVHIYAKWAVAKYDIVIYDDLNPTEKFEIEYKKIPTLVEPNEEGYIFDGWYIDEDCTVKYVPDKVTADLELFVKWNYRNYEIEYVNNGGMIATDFTTEYNVGDTIVLPIPQKTGYTFEGWYENEDFSGDSITEFSGEIGNKKFYAKYLCDLTTLEAKSGLSAVNGTNCEFYSDSLEKNIDLKEYFTFADGCTYLVYLNEEKTQLSKGNTVNLENNETETGILREYNFIIMIISESERTSSDYYLTVYQYDRNVITISYYVDNEKVDEVNINRGHPSEIYYWGGEKVGYEFVCWMKDSEEYIFGTTVTEDIRLDAKFTPILFSIEYNVGAGSNSNLNKTEYTVEDSFELEDAVCPIGYGYTFAGWYKDADYSEENKISEIDSAFGDIKLYAKYTKDSILDFEPDEEGKFEITKNQYEEFINFVVYNRLSSVDVTISGVANNDEFAQINDINIYVPFTDYSQSISYSVRESESLAIAKLTYTYNQAEEPSKTSNTGTYSQNNFEKWVMGSGRDGYTDFAINYVATTLNVKTGDQLYFALENGYRPLCVEGSTAEEVYEEAKEILNSILDVNMTEKQKAMAIAEYLVESVAYDNYVLALFNSVYEPGISEEERNLRNAAIKEYRSFYPEAAIIDKVAVCDGISKAYVILCAMEGIRAVQVDGTNKKVNHAWNKVYVDVDGNGTREWSVVDCTSANMLISSGIELMDHAFIFATDDMILSNDVNYEYNEKWQEGLSYKYPTTEIINVYDTYKVNYNGTEISLYAESKDELTNIFRYIKQVYDSLETGTEMCFDFSVSTVLYNLDWTHDIWIIDTMQTIFNTGISHCKCEGQTENDGVIILILEK